MKEQLEWRNAMIITKRKNQKKHLEQKELKLRKELLSFQSFSSIIICYFFSGNMIKLLKMLLRSIIYKLLEKEGKKEKKIFFVKF